MEKLTPAVIHNALHEGQSVRQISESCGVSSSRVYQLMRVLGRSASQIAADRCRRVRATVECRSFDGYRISTTDGRVQSCWATGKNARKTDLWHDVTIQIHRPGTRWASLYVRLGGEARRRRPTLRTLYRDAFGPRQDEAADALYQKVCRRIGLQR